MTDDRKAKKLETVRGLLAKAASTNHPEEAALFQAKADELMARYAIEEFELAKVDGGSQKPEYRDVSIAWWWDMDGGLDDALWRLFWHCANHARCRTVTWKATSYTKSIPVVGMPNDLDYMDLLFTDLMTQLVGTLDPRPDKSLSYFENLKRMREAGNSWPDVATKMLAAGFDPRPDSASKKVKQDQMTRDYRNECKKRGIPQNYNHFRTYGRNFADGFVTVIAERMREMRKTTQGESTPGGSMALALRDIRQVVDDAVDEMFGRPKQTAGSRAMVRDNRKIDMNARGAGGNAGKSARIAGSAAGLKQRGQLGK